MDKSKLMELGLAEEAAERIAAALEGYAAPQEVAALRERIAELEAELTEQARTHAEEMRRARIEFSVNAALKTAGARNLRAARALIDDAKLALGEDGTVDGLEEQIAALLQAADSEFLFEKRKLRGVEIGEDAAEGFEERMGLEGMSYDELCSYFEK